MWFRKRSKVKTDKMDMATIRKIIFDEAIEIVDRRYCSAGHHPMIDGKHQLVVIMDDLRAAGGRPVAQSLDEDDPWDNVLPL